MKTEGIKNNQTNEELTRLSALIGLVYEGATEDTTANITLSRRVLALIDETAKRAGESRSGFLARAGIEAAQHAAHTGR